jgi:hypothetical protein
MTNPGVVVEAVVGGACDQTGTGAVADGLPALRVALGDGGRTHMLAEMPGEGSGVGVRGWGLGVRVLVEEMPEEEFRV